VLNLQNYKLQITIMKQLQKKWYCNKINCFIIIIFLSYNSLIKAQVNLIPNASFEDTIDVSTIHGQLCLRNWHVLDSTRLLNCLFTYFHYNSQVIGFGLPGSAYFYQEPHSGYGFIDLGVYWFQTWWPLLLLVLEV
jgi:hypothetical protein